MLGEQRLPRRRRHAYCILPPCACGGAGMLCRPHRRRHRCTEAASSSRCAYVHERPCAAFSQLRRSRPPRRVAPCVALASAYTAAAPRAVHLSGCVRSCLHAHQHPPTAPHTYVSAEGGGPEAQAEASGRRHVGRARERPALPFRGTPGVEGRGSAGALKAWRELERVGGRPQAHHTQQAWRSERFRRLLCVQAIHEDGHMLRDVNGHAGGLHCSVLGHSFAVRLPLRAQLLP